MSEITSGTMTGYFDRAYRDYQLQNPVRKLDHYLDVIDRGIGPGPKSLLDIGCGLGAFLERAAYRHRDWQFAGSDIEMEAMSAITRRLPQAAVAQGSAEDVLFPQGRFDIITAWDVFEHVPDLEAVAVSVAQMSKPGGFLFFVVPVYDGLTGPVIRRLDKDPTHLHKWSRSQWIDWANQHFDEVAWHGLLRYLVGRTYLHVPTTLARSHTPAILVCCRIP